MAERLETRGMEDEGQKLRDILTQITRGPTEVSSSVAGEILHLPAEIVRNWIRGGILPGRQDNDGQFYVSLDVLEPTIQLNLAMPDVPDHLAAITDEEIDAAIEAVRARRRSRASTPG